MTNPSSKPTKYFTGRFTLLQAMGLLAFFGIAATCVVHYFQ